MDYLRDNWLAMVSLFIALTGGIPGVLAAVQHLRRKPSFQFTLTGLMTGDVVLSGADVRGAMILLSGAIANGGDRPLSPSEFRLFVRLKRGWLQFHCQQIPPDATFPSEHQEITLENAAERDLLRVPETIEPGAAAHGHLMFLGGGVDAAELRRSQTFRMKLQCRDAFGIVHSVRLRAPPRTDQGFVHPRLGIAASAKKGLP